ncbi:hypothetical protein [Leptospira licerasiae]|uniref:Phage-like element PBSX protein XkdF domain-containing protein n=1 Tax=Leptospira licerasiae str. MMD4847 TaxID=1049971 RepID=A0ABN0H9N8_9LEPT|nr:hypothetical protein [Leptospira licerasiae]EIE01493.1 hypothetical protein LEP1GSC185_3933 [Leptospira licerasiae serovar Varillal str. VAR 010]EJZ42328.1 hypothetical protein LEP1GSC178_0096 [Leptospira licerasiae str. MMD4847]
MSEKLFLHPFHILKATPEERTGAIRILIRASSEKEDRQGEIILKSAYDDPSMRAQFKAQGYLDYNHLTDLIDKEIREKKPNAVELVELQKAKSAAIIGSPEEIGTKSDFPSSLGIKEEGLYIVGRLFPGNSFVEEIRKGLQAGFNGWGASVSGFASPNDVDKNRIKRIQLRKCAIAPLQEVINPDTSVQLLKGAVMLRDLHKSVLENSNLEYENEREKEVEDSRISELERKIVGLSRLIYSVPSIQDQTLNQILTDVESLTETGSMDLRTSAIRNYLRDTYGFDNSDLESLSDAIFLNLNGG